MELNQWTFRQCWARQLTYFLHVFINMQTANMARQVFVTQVAKVANEDYFIRMEAISVSQSGHPARKLSFINSEEDMGAFRPSIASA